MEQIRGTGTNPRSDIYSLSATLYQLMTNVVPADALTRADALLNGSPDPIVPLNELNPEVPREVSDVILHGMEVSQEKRFSVAKEMQKALRKAFSQMQEAMTAQTIAFSAPGIAEVTPKIEQPVGVGQNFESGVDANRMDSEATRLRSEQHAAAVPVVTEPLIGRNGPVDGGLRQSDVRTEVFDGNSDPIFPPSERGTADVAPPAAPSDSEVWDAAPVTAGEGFSPGITSPVGTGDIGIPASPFTADETFSQPANETQDPFATRTAPVETPQPFQSVPKPVVAPPIQKKRSKAPWVVGAFAALLILGVAAVGAGWFVYTNYYAGAAATPTPEPTLEIAPTPEPTLEAVTDTNSTTEITESNSNSNTDVTTVEPTPIPELEPGTRDTTPGTRTAETRRPTTKGNPGQPAAKATPKKSNRTVILQ
jgi:hypothetical protein